MAGTWYPDNPARLVSQVDGYLERARIDDPAGRLRAIVVPHAGLMYSGPVAAYAYNVARRHQHSALVLVGPSHFVPFHGVSIWPEGAWETPLGPVQVDQRAGGGALRRASSQIVELPAAHGREHSLEMQMPFIAHLLPGRADRAAGDGPPDPRDGVRARRGHRAGRRGARTRRAARGEQRSLALRGCEHGGVRSIGVVIEHVEPLDADGLMRALDAEPRHACGGGPMVAVLDAARRLGATPGAAATVCGLRRRVR